LSCSAKSGIGGGRIGPAASTASVTRSRDDGARGVEHLGAGRVDRGADGFDAVVLDEHVAHRQLADRRVEREHVPAADQQAHAAKAARASAGSE
jgi:hypothetical protein